jgi:hypothetical protein
LWNAAAAGTIGGAGYVAGYMLGPSGKRRAVSAHQCGSGEGREGFS